MTENGDMDVPRDSATLKLKDSVGVWVLSQIDWNPRSDSLYIYIYMYVCVYNYHSLSLIKVWRIEI